MRNRELESCCRSLNPLVSRLRGLSLSWEECWPHPLCHKLCLVNETWWNMTDRDKSKLSFSLLFFQSSSSEQGLRGLSDRSRQFFWSIWLAVTLIPTSVSLWDDLSGSMYIICVWCLSLCSSFKHPRQCSHVNNGAILNGFLIGFNYVISIRPLWSWMHYGVQCIIHQTSASALMSPIWSRL